MKLNATSEMIPVTWPEFGALHPFRAGQPGRRLRQLFQELNDWLCEITGFAPCRCNPTPAPRANTPA
jgi:glycine dehydrogenase